jgi:thymidylate kinase
LIVELAGLPGCGKTTLLHLLRDDLREAGVEVHTGTRLRRAPRWLGRVPARVRKPVERIALTFGRFATMVVHLRLLALVARALLSSSRPSSDKVSAFKWLVVVLDNYRVARRIARNGVAIVPEGMTQRAYLLFVDAGGVATRRTVQRYQELAPQADLTVLVDVDVDVALRRLGSRERGLPPRFEGLPAEVVRERFREGAGLLADALGRCPRAVVVPGEGDGALAKVVTEIAALR